jgi:hypothetical protein
MSHGLSHSVCNTCMSYGVLMLVYRQMIWPSMIQTYAVVHFQSTRQPVSSCLSMPYSVHALQHTYQQATLVTNKPVH